MSTILAVEDNENNMMLVRDVLELKGYTVLAATTGTEGVRLAAQGKPDLAITAARERPAAGEPHVRGMLAP